MMHILYAKTVNFTNVLKIPSSSRSLSCPSLHLLAITLKERQLLSVWAQKNDFLA
jgi:hypothetical protein